MPDGHSNGMGTIDQRLTAVREDVSAQSERIAYVEAGLPRIEQVQHDVIRVEQLVRENHEVTKDVRDRIHNLAGVSAHRFDLQGAQLAQMNAKVDSLMALLEAIKPKSASKSAKRGKR